MTDINHMHERAALQFHQLKETLIEIEEAGFRPQLLTHGNGMPDYLRIDPAHATTPQIDKIRASKVHSS